MENGGKPVVSSSIKEEEDAKAKKQKMRLERNRRKEEDMKVLSDLSVFQNLAAMLEAERFRKKKKRRRKKKKENLSMENAGKSVISSCSKVEKDVKAKKPKMRLERKRTREKEMKVLSELSDFQYLAAMLEAERFKKKKKRRRKKKKENVEVGAQEDGADLSFTIDEEMVLQKSKRQCKKNEEVADVEQGQEQPDTVKAVTTTKALETGSVSVSESIATEKLFVDEVKAAQLNTIKAVDIRKASETESDSVAKDIVAEKLFASTFKIDEERTSQEAKKKCTKNEEVMSSLDEFKMLSDLSNFKNLAAMMEAEAFMRSKKRKKRRKKKRSREFEAPLRRNVDSVKVQKQADSRKGADTVKLFQIESIDIKDNIVLQKLLRAPRYFDPPESSWRMCHICGEEGHTIFDCPAEKRKKSCFLCGSFGHGGSHCKQACNCFAYGRSQHTRSCPEKNQGNCPSSMICLRCGASGHDMFLCRNKYSSDDLKEIQCYVCKRYGHLCCVDFPDIRESQQISCYKCGHLGHLGSDELRMGGDFTN